MYICTYVHAFICRESEKEGGGNKKRSVLEGQEDNAKGKASWE